MASEAETLHVNIDASNIIGEMKAIHGSNKGPKPSGRIDLTIFHKDIGFPFLRSHDTHGGLVDIHTIFRNFHDDPNDPGSYYFTKTDDWVTSVKNTGAQVFYRLGESIEHTERKYHTHPPEDFQKWADICVGIIKHYNQGWANGFHHNIKYWEIWNEPDLGPNMWTGSFEEYYRLYKTAAGTIKSEVPDVFIGGPAAAGVGNFKEGNFVEKPFVKGFLEHCKQYDIPLDFFSWHRYAYEPQIIVDVAAAVRQMLDKYGYEDTPSFLTEWGFAPDGNWEVLQDGTPDEKAAWFAEMSGMKGAAFAAYVLMELQNIPVDMTHFYHASVGNFGTFNRYGKPMKNYYALKAFARLAEMPLRIESSGDILSKFAVCSGIDRDNNKIVILTSNFDALQKKIIFHVQNLPWEGPISLQLSTLSSERNLETVLTQEFKSGDIYFSTELNMPELHLFELKSVSDKLISD
ncbi:MAG: hypothetical protein GF311_27795 [Candidatus Lokiarchaeota archaeon]|nr:hypothetical protein [Candidatus Lokiarchaeota archaeon]